MGVLGMVVDAVLFSTALSALRRQGVVRTNLDLLNPKYRPFMERYLSIGDTVTTFGLNLRNMDAAGLRASALQASAQAQDQARRLSAQAKDKFRDFQNRK
mmetsp:Transcript_2904/g.4527  ORF Transcript_2904/g.4527 Transcript_2904/m.4527 type:complete len:100 (+) Transcript_2904:41-340(+)